MMTLAVTGAPDKSQGPCFSGGSRWSEGPDCPDVLFCRFRHRFRAFCEGFGCFRPSFDFRPSRARKPQGGPSPPSPGYVPVAMLTRA